ncbi:hypothetical protein ETB97_009379 [Aspergillus alliaceus]|uniref:F-box domain-containing protein n=1 Tax=Petromyces alliaceus TaxID=209559 RepID=A0A8H6E8T3_PETAA|nr:hypothetical protein ETB97_009379 [Aspergillus burnettii]
MSKRNMPHLPAEVILQVIQCLVPSEPPVAFPPEHSVTQALISLTLVSSLTHQAAKRLLLKHCLYLNSGQRLDLVLPQLLGDDQKQQTQPTGLFLAPFPVQSLEEPLVVTQVDLLSSHICGSLRRLVIDMPLRDLRPYEDEQGLRKIIRAAFVRLTQLEEFCSARDELYCDTMQRGIEPPVWSLWPRLKCLALYNVAVEWREFWRFLPACPNLTHLVLTRADYLTDPMDPDAVGLAWWSSLKRILIVNGASGHLSDLRLREPGWETSVVGQLGLPQPTVESESNKLTVEFKPSLEYFCIDVPPEKEDDLPDICQEWVCEQATRGTLWDLPGSRYVLHD